MYELYNYRNPMRIAVGILFLVPVFAFPYGLYQDYLRNGFNLSTVMFAFFIIFFLLLSILIFTIRSDPYERFKKWKQEDPALTDEMEKDFLQAKAYGHNIFKGERFYFFKGDDFFVIPIGGIYSIEISSFYRRRIGVVNKGVFTSEKGAVTVEIVNLVQTYEECLKLFDEMAFESGIAVKRI